MPTLHRAIVALLLVDPDVLDLDAVDAEPGALDHGALLQ